MPKVLSLRLFRNNDNIFDMTTIEIKGTTRSEFGKKGSKLDRSNGLVPAVMYGGDDVVHFTVTPASVKNLVYTPDFSS